MAFDSDQLIVGDCIQEMQKIPDDSVDMTFADPPFNLGKRYAAHADGQAAEDYLTWSYQWLDEMVRITKPTGSIIVHNIPKWLTYFSSHLNRIANFKHWIAWHAMSTPLGNTLFPTHYGILFYTKSPTGFKFYEIRSPHPKCRKCGEFHKDYGGKSDQRHPFGPLVGDVWTDIHRIRHSKKRDPHPCQLPVHLLERIILMTTDPGDIILDPFIGTGTTAIAARSLNRYCIGIDNHPEYVEIAARKRNAAEIKRFGPHYVSRHLDQVVTMRDIDAKQAFPPQYTSIDKKKDRAARSNGAIVLMEDSPAKVWEPIVPSPYPPNSSPKTSLPISRHTPLTTTHHPRNLTSKAEVQTSTKTNPNTAAAKHPEPTATSAQKRRKKRA